MLLCQCYELDVIDDSEEDDDNDNNPCIRQPPSRVVYTTHSKSCVLLQGGNESYYNASYHLEKNVILPARSFSFRMKKELGVGLSHRLHNADVSQDSSKRDQ